MIGGYFRRLRGAVSTLAASHGSASLANEAAASATLAAASNKATMAGAGTAVGSWFLSNEFFGIVGVAVGVIGLAANIYFKRREFKLKRAALARELRLKEKYMEREDRRKAERHASTMQSEYGHSSKRRCT